MVAVLKSDESVTPFAVDSMTMRAPARELAKVTAALARVADRKSTLPMLANVKIAVSREGVTLTATDLNVTATYQTRAWVAATWGEFTAPAKVLADLLKGMCGDTVLRREVGSLGLTVKHDAMETILIGMPARDFPKVPATHDALAWTPVAPDVLCSLIERCLPTVCKDETRFHLNGILLESGGSQMRAVSTDGHRLTRATVGSIVDAPRIPGAILPAKAATEIARMLDSKSKDPCEVALDKLVLYVRQGAWTLACKLIDAQFPPYEQVIPKDHDNLATVDRKALIAALKRHKGLYCEGRGVKLSLASRKLSLTFDHPDLGSASEVLGAKGAWVESGGAFTIGANPSYLIAALSEIDCKDVTIFVGNNELDPMIVRGTDDACSYDINGSRFLVVVMPMRI